MAQLTREQRMLLRKLLNDMFDMEDVLTCMFDLNIDRDSIVGKTKSAQIRELIVYLERTELVPELIAWARESRPSAPWPNITPTVDEITPAFIEVIAPSINKISLYELLLQSATSNELREFCFRLNVAYEEVVGPNDKIRAAIQNILNYFEARGRLVELIAQAQREFPNINWHQVYEAGSLPPITTSASMVEDSDTLEATATVSSLPRAQTRIPSPLRIFLCHASEDKAAARDLHRLLKAEGMQPWLDEEDLELGQEWRVEIPKVIQASDVILVCLSNRSIQKDGYVKREIEFALDIVDKQTNNRMLFIPVRLEDCAFPDRVGDRHGVDWFSSQGPERLMQAIRQHARRLGATVAAPNSKVSAPAPPKPAIDSLIIELPKLKFHLDLVHIPAGPFMIGDDRYDDEEPIHMITLPEYWIGKYPVTNAQFAAFVQSTKHKTAAEKKGSSDVWDGKAWKDTKGADWQHPTGPESDIKQKADHPVVHVSWHDAQAFCKWLSHASGHKIVLPSEAEWEKAARGSPTSSNDLRAYPWGNKEPDKTLCNFNENEQGTTPVGKYSPKGDSPYGCVDMAGNVWEWTRSLWDKNRQGLKFTYPYKTDDGREDETADNNVSRVVRGHSWVDRENVALWELP